MHDEGPFSVSYSATVSKKDWRAGNIHWKKEKYARRSQTTRHVVRRKRRLGVAKSPYVMEKAKKEKKKDFGGGKKKRRKPEIEYRSRVEPG